LQRAIEEIRSVPSPSREIKRLSAGANIVARIDDFLEELEGVHLSGGVRVPKELVERLTAFLEILPPGWPTAFPVRTRIAFVIEDLFNLQEHALNLKVCGRRSLRSLDDAIDHDGHSDRISRRAERRRRNQLQDLLG